MTSPTRTCAECGAALTGKRPNQVYCGDRCRQRGHRSQRRRLAGEVTGWFSGQLSTNAEPITRLADHMARTADGTPGWRAQVAQLMAYRPDVAEAFGSAVLTACAAPLPATQCRTCYSVMLAEMTDAPLPVPDAANRALLGELCPRCLTALRQAARLRMPYLE
jgi:predicted nucleic acid-binding Zn ribbon protein